MEKPGMENSSYFLNEDPLSGLLESIVPTGAESAVRGHEPLASHQLPKAVHRDHCGCPASETKTHTIIPPVLTEDKKPL